MSHDGNSPHFFLSVFRLMATPLIIGLFFCFLKLYWSIVDLQCDNFCWTTERLTYMCTCIHSLSDSFPTLFPTVYDRILGRVPCATQRVPFGQSFHIPHCACANPKPQSLPPPCLFDSWMVSCLPITHASYD